MNFYRMEIATYAYGKYAGARHFKTIEENEPEAKEIPVTWGNLQDILNKYFVCGFTVWNWNKGRMIEIYSDNISSFKGERRNIKEWKTAEIPITIKITYEKIEVSLEDVLKYSDSEKAIKYLKERGMTMCGMGI